MLLVPNFSLFATMVGQVSELVSLENERREKLFLEEEARAELFRRVEEIRTKHVVSIYHMLNGYNDHNTRNIHIILSQRSK